MRHVQNLLLLARAYESHVLACNQAAHKAKLAGDAPSFYRWHFRSAKYARLALDMRQEAIAMETDPRAVC